MKIIWFSRHDLTPQQRDDLAIKLGLTIEVTSVNMTYPADGYKAASDIFDYAFVRGASAIAGVFPAHVALQLQWRLQALGRSEVLAIPVSMPAPAVAGETRNGGFVHSHWELFNDSLR